MYVYIVDNGSDLMSFFMIYCLIFVSTVSKNGDVILIVFCCFTIISFLPRFCAQVVLCSSIDSLSLKFQNISN